MFRNSDPPVRRPSADSDEHNRRDSRVSLNNNQQIHSYTNAHSPTQYAACSPTNGTHPQSPYNQHPPSRPSTSATVSLPSAISPHLGPPPSPKINGPTQNTHHRQSSGSSKFYDPTSEYREPPGWSETRYPVRSPVQVCRLPC